MAYRSPLMWFVLALAAVVLPAQATKVQVSHFPPNPGVLPGGGWKFTPNTTFADPPPPRQWVEGVYGAQPSPAAPALIVKDAVKLAGRAGDLPVTVSQAMQVVDLGISVASCIYASKLACVSAGVAAIQLYDRYRVRPASGGGLEADPGQPQQDVATWLSSGSNSKWSGATGSSAMEAVANGLARYPSSHSSGGVGYVDVTFSLGSCGNNGPKQLVCDVQQRTVFCYLPQYNLPCDPATVSSAGTISADSTVVKQCPAVIDFSDPQYSVSGGAVKADGQCPTGRYSGISVADAGAKVAQYPPTLPDAVFKQAVIDAIDNGGQTAPGDLTSSGPASQTGTPTSSTTTDSSGTKTTTSTPTYTYHYDGDTITYDTSSSVQTCVGANSCSTTTTTTPASPPDSQDPNDPCTKSPDTIGCSKYGTPPDGEAIQTKDLSASITPQSGFGADNASCPGPITLSNGVVVDPYALFCKYMGGIRFAVLGVAWIIAALIFVGRTD